MNEPLNFSLLICILLLISVGYLNSVGRYYKLPLALFFVFHSFTQIFTKVSAITFSHSVVDKSDSL